MHKLSQKHPVSVKIGGVDVPINHSYQYALEADQVLNSSRLKREENAGERINRLLFAMYDIGGEHDGIDEELKMQAFLEYFSEEIGTENVEEAILQALWFLRCGEEVDESKPNKTALIDFSHDAQHIYSAFLKSGTDLNEVEQLHFWKFCAIMKELPEGVTIGRLAYLRDKWQKNKLDKNEKEEVKRYGKSFYIENDDDKEAKDFWNNRLPD